MKKFRLTWVDDTPATYPDVVEDGRQKSYEFEVEGEDEAKAFVRSFIMINDNHDFKSYELREITKGDE